MARPARDLAERFWEKVEKTDGCWLWRSKIARDGYGHFTTANSVSQRAHRVAFELSYGPIPTGALVLHKCDNRRCVNPDHLFLGDYRDNARDMVAKGRQWGRRKLTDDQVRLILKLLADGRSQQSIADEVGISQITVSRIKLGQRLYLRSIRHQRKT